MFHRNDRNGPGLLVSVRSASEALAALAGGADVIDVKEPNRGSLGAAASEVIAAVVHAVKGRAPVTAATGELFETLRADPPMIPAGVSLFKIGLAGCGNAALWPSRWREAIAAISNQDAAIAPRPVAVAYADWRAADAPMPEHVLSVAVELGCSALLIDTWNKSAGSLFDHWPLDGLRRFIKAVRSHDLAVVLAGSLSGESFAAAARLDPDLVAVRAAACAAGRRGTVSSQRVHALRQVMLNLRRVSNIVHVPARFTPAKDFS